MFSVGQMVVCIDPVDELERGRVYTISDICRFFGAVMIDLEETPGHPPGAWNPRRFKPVKDTSIGIFRQLVANPKDKVRA